MDYKSPHLINLFSQVLIDNSHLVKMSPVTMSQMLSDEEVDIKLCPFDPQLWNCEGQMKKQTCCAGCMYVICHFTSYSTIVSASLRSETFAVFLFSEVPNSSGNSV